MPFELQRLLMHIYIYTIYMKTMEGKEYGLNILVKGVTNLIATYL